MYTLTMTVNPISRTRSYSANASDLLPLPCYVKLTSPTQAYFAPNASRPNLTVLPNAQVTRITLDEDSNGEYRATGVEFVVGEETFIVRANKEVILSSGELHSFPLYEEERTDGWSIFRIDTNASATRTFRYLNSSVALIVVLK
jgi:choline dehydrogenase-like flavoprotein